MSLRQTRPRPPGLQISFPSTNIKRDYTYTIKGHSEVFRNRETENPIELPILIWERDAD